jgi:hypothetical protein
VATGKPATFRPPHFILVSSPTDCPHLSSSCASPVQLAPAGIFPEQEEVTFLFSQILYPVSVTDHPRFTPYTLTSSIHITVYPFFSPHIFTPFLYFFRHVGDSTYSLRFLLFESISFFVLLYLFVNSRRICILSVQLKLHTVFLQTIKARPHVQS